MLPKRLRVRRLVHLVFEAVSSLTKGGRVGSKKTDTVHELAKSVGKGAAAAAVTSGGSLAAVGVGALAGAAGHVASTTLEQILKGIARARGVDGPLGEATLVELEERGPELEAKLTRLLEVAGDDQAKRARAVASFEALIHAWMKAGRRAADDRKRRILMAALVSGLDEDAYREGLALAILERLERLDYGAIRLLARLDEERPGSDDIASNSESLDGFHADCLAAEGLARCRRPVSHDKWRVTELGKVALRFVGEELQSHMREEGGDAE